MSSITYHFGGKEGLYLAAADHVALHVRGKMEPLLQTAEAALQNADASQAVDLIVALIDRQAEMLLSLQAQAWSRFVVREQQQPTEAFERIYETALEPIIDLLSRLVGRACPTLDAHDQRAMAILLFGQPLILRIGQAAICRTLGCETLGDSEGERLRDRVRKNVRCILSENDDG